MFELGLLALFGLLGYAMRKLDYPTAPLVLGLVLGDAMERALRQSLMMSQGDISILFRPIPAGLLASRRRVADRAAVQEVQCDARAGARPRRPDNESTNKETTDDLRSE